MTEAMMVGDPRKAKPAPAAFDPLSAAQSAALDLTQITIRDFDGTIRVWTRGMERLYGYSSEEARGQVSHRLLRTEFPAPLSAIESELLDRGEWSGELEHQHRNGQPLQVVSHWSLDRNDSAARPLVSEVNHDITELKRMRRRDALLADVLESSQDAVLIKTLDGLVTDMNPAAERLYGFSGVELIGKSIFLLYPPNLIEQEKAIIERVMQGERIEHFETARLRKDGAAIEVSLSISPVRDDAGRIVGASHMARDVTERNAVRRRLESLQFSLAHVGRINTMGQMASALAHELNQPLTALNNYLAAAQRVAAQDEVDRVLLDGSLEKAREQAIRTADIISHLRSFLGRGKAERSLANINEVIEDSVRLGTLDAAPNEIPVTMNLDPTVEALLIDPVQIGQIVVNLVRNAVEAMRDSERRELAISSKASETAVEITVSDTGPGIPPEILPNLFQPFVTSKATGMGIGLSICRELAQAHGGRLTVAGRERGGTVFTLILPR